MTDTKISLNNWIAKYDNGDFDSKDLDTMIDAGWHDWFCADSSLYNRLKKMVSMVKAAANSEVVNGDEVYVFFKNNAPFSGGTYDSFSLCELKGSQDVVWWVAPNGFSGATVMKAPFFEDENNLLGEYTIGVRAIKKFFKDTKSTDLLVLQEINSNNNEKELDEGSDYFWKIILRAQKHFQISEGEALKLLSEGNGRINEIEQDDHDNLVTYYFPRLIRLARDSENPKHRIFR